MRPASPSPVITGVDLAYGGVPACADAVVREPVGEVDGPGAVDGDDVLDVAV
jgi:hypothetical protein